MKWLSAIMMVLCLASCQYKNEGLTPFVPVRDYSHEVTGIKFGWFCGECTRPYSNGYKLTPFGLYTDVSGTFKEEGDRFVHFSNTPLDSSKYMLARLLFNDVNSYLLSHAHEVYECPESNDGNGLYIEIETLGGTYRYKTNNQEIYKYPDSLKSFLIRVNRVIRQINREELNTPNI